MRKILLLSAAIIISIVLHAQTQNSPCKSDTVYRQLDFWIGEWDVYGLNGKKAGDSKIEMILDSCIILEITKLLMATIPAKALILIML